MSAVASQPPADEALPSESAWKIKQLLRITHFMNDATHPDIPVSYMRVFLLVGLKPGLTISDYAAASGLTLSGVSRALIQLSDIRRQADPGPDLVRVVVNLYNRRQKNVMLTAKGQKLFDYICAALTD